MPTPAHPSMALAPIKLRVWVPAEDAGPLAAPRRVAEATVAIDGTIHTEVLPADTFEGAPSAWGCVQFSGTAAKCFAAYEALIGTNAEVDTVVAEFQVHPTKVSAFAPSQSVRAIGATHHVRLHLPKEADSPAVVMIEGDFTPVAAAFYELQLILWNIGVQRIQTKVNIPEYMMGCVIGKGGATITEIKEKSGAYVVFPLTHPQAKAEGGFPEDNGKTVEATVTGPTDSVLLAQELIQRIMSGHKISAAVVHLNSNIGAVLGVAQVLARSTEVPQRKPFLPPPGSRRDKPKSEHTHHHSHHHDSEESAAAAPASTAAAAATGSDEEGEASSTTPRGRGARRGRGRGRGAHAGAHTPSGDADGAAPHGHDAPAPHSHRGRGGRGGRGGSHRGGGGRTAATEA